MADEPNFITVEEQSDRRRARDRRRFTSRTLIYGFLYGRRRHLRRDNDRYRGGYVDRHEPQLLFSTLGILLLSLTDAALTLTLMQFGAVELNTFMAVLIETDVQLFISTKMAITGTCIILLLIHAKFRLFRVVKVSHLIHFCLSTYLLLVTYELVLLAAVVGARLN